MCLDLQYHQRLCDYLNTYERAFVVGADNVGSKQMSDIRAVGNKHSKQLQAVSMCQQHSSRRDSSAALVAAAACLLLLLLPVMQAMAIA